MCPNDQTHVKNFEAMPPPPKKNQRVFDHSPVNLLSQLFFETFTDQKKNNRECDHSQITPFSQSFIHDHKNHYKKTAFSICDHSFSTFAKFSEKLTFLTP